MTRLPAWLLLIVAGALGAQQQAPSTVPSATEALAAYETFRARPLTRLDHTRPFLDFIRDSGQVHIVLTQALLGWMYEPMDPQLKAVLYAAFLGGNMAAQLARGERPGEPGADDLAAVSAALEAYRAIRSAHPDFRLTLFEDLARAETADTLAARVAQLTADDTP